MFCAISGVPPTDPVISKKSGHVYERSLIEKYLRDNDGRDPVTGDQLTVEDLISVKPGPTPAPARPASITSVPALIRSLQDEWDTAMLETLAVRKDAERMRQELSHALYKEDATMRVLARVIRERDEAREALANIQGTLGLSATNKPSDDDMAVDGPAKPEQEGLGEDATKRVKETAATLSATRKKRKVPEGYVGQDDVKEYNAVQEVKSMHAAKPPGITAMSATDNGKYILTGGADKNVQIYDRESEKVVATAKGHTKKVTGAYFLKPSTSSSSEDGGGLPEYIVTSSLDTNIRIWSVPQDNKKTCQVTGTLSQHSADVTGISVHPSGTLVASCSLDNTFAIHDVESPTEPKTLYQLGLPPAQEGGDPNSVGGATSISFHPDGALVAVGGGDGLVRVFEVGTAKLATVFRPPEGQEANGPVSAMSFSENGYLFASASSTKGSPVQIWDLRKLSLVKNIDAPSEDSQVYSVLFDPSAQFLTVAGSDCRIYANKTWNQLLSYDGNSAEFTGIAWANKGSQLILSSMDRTLRVLSKPQ